MLRRSQNGGMPSRPNPIPWLILASITVVWFIAEEDLQLGCSCTAGGEMSKYGTLFKAVAERLVVCYDIPRNFRSRMDEWVSHIQEHQPKAKMSADEWRELVHTMVTRIADQEKWNLNPEMHRCWEGEENA